jgi:hypothetical protein
MNTIKRHLTRIGCVVVIALAAVASPAQASAAGPSDNADCVGQFSSYFAHGGGGRHRSEVAQNFAHNAAPAGRNVYSHVATGHGSLESCDAQFS